MLLHILLYNIAPVFFLISLGYVMGKKYNLDIGSLSKLSVYIFIPSMIFLNLYETAVSMEQLIPVAFTVIFVIIMSLVGSVTGKIRRYSDSRKNAVKNALMFYNSGNFGIPLISLVFANTPMTDYAVSIQIMVMISQNLLNYSLGFYNAARGSMDFKSSMKSVLKMPAIHAIIAALIAKAIPYDFRNFFLWPAITYAGNAMFAVNLLILGIQLSLTKFEFKNKEVYLTSFFRLCIGPVIAYLLILLLRIDGIMARVLMISSGLPTAVNTVLIAAEFDNEPEFATQTVVVTTLFCLFTLPLVIYLAQTAF